MLGRYEKSLENKPKEGKMALRMKDMVAKALKGQANVKCGDLTPLSVILFQP